MADNCAETEEGAVAFAFASALVHADFIGAHSMLAKAIRETTTADDLRTHYEQMLSYAESEPTMIEVMSIGRDFPWLKQDELAMVYTAINGEGFCEAVDLLLCRENDRIAIKDIVWGRP